MVAKKMWTLTIRIKKGRRAARQVAAQHVARLMMGAGVLGATVVNAVDGFGRRGRSTLHVEGISMNYRLVIEVVDEKSKLEPLLPQIKRMVADNGIVTLHEASLL
jgi:uncharacterized protein